MDKREKRSHGEYSEESSEKEQKIRDLLRAVEEGRAWKLERVAGTGFGRG